MTEKSTEALPSAAAVPAAPEAIPAPLGVAISERPAMCRILATKPIPRRVGPDIAPGQVVSLPAAQAEVEIKAGRASDPDAKAKAKN